MSLERNDMDEGPLEEVSGHEENYEGSKSSLSETYDMRDFCPGIRIEAQDFDGKWYPAKVADVDWTENEILVHFENRNTKFDEWIPMDSSRLRSLPKPLSQTQKDAVKFVKGEEVMAMWSPYQKYPATIQAVLSNDRYDVLFYDGFLKRLKAQKISKADGGMVRSEVRNFSDIGTKEERRERKRKINVAELFHVNKRTKKKGLIHSKTQEMKTYPVNKSHAKSSIIKKSLQLPQEKEHAAGSESTLSRQFNIKTLAQTTNSYASRSLIDTIPAAVEVKYIDGRTEMWSKQLYQRSEGRTAGKLDIVILNPQGRKFRSRNEIMKYCEENGIIYTHEAFDFSAKGRPKSKSVVQGLSAKTEVSSEESDKMLLKKFWRKSQIDETLSGTSTTQVSPVPVENSNFVEDKVFIGDVEVVIENGKFICPVKICGKHFRRENLLHMHVKHYHPEFSKYLDYTPSVTDLAYMRTVGSLESTEPLLSAPRKSTTSIDKTEKTAVKIEKSTKSVILVSEGNKEVKKTSQKSFEGKIESKTITTKVSSHANSPSPISILPEANEENKSHESVSETLQILKSTVPSSSNQTITHESKGSVLQEPLIEVEAIEAEDLASSNNVSKIVKHNRFYRQKKGSRIRGSFVDRIKKTKYIGQDLSRSTSKLGRQHQTQTTRPSTPMELPSHPLMEDLSNSNTSSQPLLTPRTPKLQLSVPNEISGKNNLMTNFTNAPMKERKTSHSSEKDEHQENYAFRTKKMNQCEVGGVDSMIKNISPLRYRNRSFLEGLLNAGKLNSCEQRGSCLKFSKKNRKERGFVNPLRQCGYGWAYELNKLRYESANNIEGDKIFNNISKNTILIERSDINSVTVGQKFYDNVVKREGNDERNCMSPDFVKFRRNKSKSKRRYKNHKQKRKRMKKIIENTSTNYNTESSQLNKLEISFESKKKEKKFLAAENGILSGDYFKEHKESNCREKRKLEGASGVKNTENRYQIVDSKTNSLNIMGMDLKARVKFERHLKSSHVLLENIFHNVNFRKINELLKCSQQEGEKKGQKTALRRSLRKKYEFRCNPLKYKKKVRFQDLVDSGSKSDDRNDLGANHHNKRDLRRLNSSRDSNKGCRFFNSLKKNLNGKCTESSSTKDKKFLLNFELSNCLDHVEGTEDSKSPFTVENEKVEKLRRNEIINCICGITEEDGLMIQCDLCLCWQHGHCMDILRDADVPDKYICSICKNPFRGRSSMKYMHDQEWLKEGTLPCLSFRSKRNDIIEQRRTILKRSYDLSGSISLLSQVIHSLRVKVNIAEKKDHPKLWLWAKKWIEKKPTRIIEDVKEEKPADTGIITEQKTEGLFSGEEQQLPKVPEPEAPIDSAECRLNLLDHLIHYQTLVDARLSCIESLVAELESMQDDVVDDEDADKYPRTKATIQMILRDLNTMKKIAAI